MNYELYTDGAFSKGGRGGWAWALVENNELRTFDSGPLDDTTNQRAELTGAVKGFDYLARQLQGGGHPREITLVSDSAYLINCLLDKWYEKWLRNGFLNSSDEPVANKDLWLDLLTLLEDRWIAGLPTDYVHMRGHGKDKSVAYERVYWNSYVDDLAVRAKSIAEP